MYYSIFRKATAKPVQAVCCWSMSYWCYCDIERDKKTAVMVRRAVLSIYWVAGA